MIADDIDAIRAGIRKLHQDKVLAEAEAARKAAADNTAVVSPTQKNLFPEQGAPFRGFFVTEDGDIVPCSINKSFGIHNGGTVIPQPVDNRADPWDDVTLDGGSHMWGKL